MGISVCIPTYKGVNLLDETLRSVLKQTYKDFEVIICNDSMDDGKEMVKLVESYNDIRVHFTQNEKNLGYPLNLRKCISLAKNEFLFLLGQDDLILDEDHFKKVVEVFANPEIGAITRPYYWFAEDWKTPIRDIPPIDQEIISIDDDPKYIRALLHTLGQLSGLVYKKSLITHEFNEHVFPAHIYPFLSILKTHKCYYWPEYTIAVRTLSSQTRFLSSIYHPSPTKTWVDMFNIVFPGEKYRRVRKIGIDHICTHHVGMLQIKNYGYYSDLLADIYNMIVYRPKNLLDVRFIFLLIFVLSLPRTITQILTAKVKLLIKKSKYKFGLNI